MTPTATAILASFSAGAVLTLVLPLAVLLAVVAWYTWIWRRGAGER
ncbi:MAG TPA: hypothetical protein VHU13_03805 [Solirubrobacteraceae bacterium]|nr:hypothetical protein [Solirubrobacteraceae bacterium]